MSFLNIKSYTSAFLFLFASSVFAAPADLENNTNAVKPIDQFNASIGLGLENSNNITLAAYSQKSDTILHETLSANYTRRSPTVQTLFSLSADRQHYQNHTFADQNVFSSLLDFNTILIKNRFTWNVSNRFERVPISTASLNLPNNQENTNTFKTGPTYTVFHNARQSLNLALAYNKFYTQKSDIDSSGYSGHAVYNRNLTRSLAVKLDVVGSERNFSNTAVNTDYRRSDAVATITKKLRLSEVYVATGKTRIVRKDNTNVEHGIFRMGYEYHIPDFSTLKISYDRELSDFTGVFSNVSQPGQILPSVGSQIFVMQRGSFSAKRKFGKSNIGFVFSYFGAQYENSVSNSTIRVSELTYDESLTSSLNMKLTGSYAVNTYNTSNRKDTSAIYTALLSKQIAGAYMVSLRLQFTQRESNLAAFTGNERRIAVNGQYFF